MRILIGTTLVPFIYGGAEYLVDSLERELRKRGHLTQQIKIPFKWYPAQRILEHILACRLLDLSESCGEEIDLFIGMKFPAYCIPHHTKVLWIVHQHKSAYELWDTEYCDIPHTPEGESIRKAIKNSDSAFIEESKKIFAISHVVASRLKKFNDIDSNILYPPLPDSDSYYCEGFDKYLLYPSRFSTIKRQILAVKAMKFVRSDIKLILFGQSEDKSYLNKIKELIENFNLEERVKILGPIGNKEKLRLYANALGVIYIPCDEDYGFVTLESFYSEKPIIVCTDSAGPLEFVEDGLNGFISNPTPRDIADSIEKLCSIDHRRLRDMGKNGKQKLISLNISWDKVIEAILK